MTTVGYGDTFPVTGTGRLVAVALMLVGISLVGVITAAWFIAQTRAAEEQQDADIAVRLARIEAKLEQWDGTAGSPRPADRCAPASTAAGRRG